MNRQLKSLAYLTVVLVGFSTVNVNAQSLPDNNICRVTGVTLFYLNGVQTTPSQANREQLALRRIHGDATEAEEQIQYEVLYNYSSGFKDIVETFGRSLEEQDGLLEGRFELFFEALAGDGAWWNAIKTSVTSTADILSGFVELYEDAAVQNLTTLFNNPPTAVNYQEHRTRIANRVLEGKKILFVAHSQGNLFVNAAYDFAASTAPVDSVKVVHIAPATTTLRGSHTLADTDLVINGLRAVGSVVDSTDTIPDHLSRAAGQNGKTDILGHGLVEIYMNPALSVSTRVRNQVDSALNSLATTTPQASSGYFSATLTWDGTGDVDLHTFEPGGSHVYFSSKQGEAGFLDVDNVTSFGPEHYYASCDSSVLQTGTYNIRVANYNDAEGRNATVQIASWNDGVLGTRTKLMGASTLSDPVYTYFDVTVIQDPDTEKFSITVE